MKKRRSSLIVLLLTVSVLMTAPGVPATAAEPEVGTSDQEIQLQDDTGKSEEPDVSEETLQEGKNAESESEQPEKEVEPEVQSEEEPDTSGKEEEPDNTATTVDVPEGEGTLDFPYEIGTKEELLWFAGLVNGTLEDGGNKRCQAQ